jgi:catechol 2,3-dioxygenase-like lactoylglutathione lyase family enzyme
MTESTTKTQLRQVGTVFVPVTDQDRALEFYLEKLGFEKRADFSYGEGHRWIEVAPPGSTIAIALVPPSEGESAGVDEARCAFSTEDIDADHATLREAGVDVDAEIGREGTSRPGLFSPQVEVRNPMPPQFSFRDPDGNRFLDRGVATQILLVLDSPPCVIASGRVRSPIVPPRGPRSPGCFPGPMGRWY